MLEVHVFLIVQKMAANVAASFTLEEEHPPGLTPRQGAHDQTPDVFGKLVRVDSGGGGGC